MRTKMLLAVVGVLWTGVAAANDCAELRAKVKGDPLDMVISTLARNDCLGGERDKFAAVARVQDVLYKAAKVEGKPVTRKDVTLSHEERNATIRQSLAIVREYAKSVANGAQPDEQPAASAISKAVDQLDDAIAVDRRDQLQALLPTFWRLDVGPVDGKVQIRGPGVDLSALLERAGCTSNAQAVRCEQANATAEGIVRIAVLTERALSVRVDESLLAEYRDAKRRDARWRSYFEDVKSQYFWENLINGQRYQSSISGKGFSDPPTSQLIVFHPNVGMEYVSSAEAGSKLKPALVIEVIGYNRWTWGSDNKPQNAWGVSLVRTYADRAGVRSSAWGVSALMLNKYALTVTRRDGNNGFMLSADLAKAFTKAGEDAREKFRLGL